MIVAALLVFGGLLIVTAGARGGIRLPTRRAAGMRRSADEQREIVEAVASWTENLRDTIAASGGLEQAIVSTGTHAPRVLRPAVQRLTASLRYGTLEDGLVRFADDVAHPTCDFVVAALVTASRHQTRDVAALLGHLASCARAECDLYLRIWVSRARSRTAVRIITVAVATFVTGLLVLNPAYLLPFVSVEGAAVAVLVVVLFVGALVWMHRIADVETPGRFVAVPGASR